MALEGCLHLGEAILRDAGQDGLGDLEGLHVLDVAELAVHDGVVAVAVDDLEAGDALKGDVGGNGHCVLRVSGGCHVRNIRAIPTRVKSVDTMTGIPYSPIKHGSVGKNPSTRPLTPCEDPGAPNKDRHSSMV